MTGRKSGKGKGRKGSIKSPAPKDPKPFDYHEWERCYKHVFTTEEICLLTFLNQLEQPHIPKPPPPLWEQEDFHYNTVHPEESPFYHYCRTPENVFLFCRDVAECICNESELYKTLIYKEYLTQNMIRNKMGLQVPELELQLQQRAVHYLNRVLKANCDRILEGEIPFLVEAPILKRACDALHLYNRNREKFEEYVDKEYLELILFLSDFFAQTPSLCVVKGPKQGREETGNGSGGSPGGSEKGSVSSLAKKVTASTSNNNPPASETFVDISLFKNLKTLELRSISPSKIVGLNGLRLTLKKVKCSRNLKALSQILRTAQDSSSALAGIWNELRDLDLSYNKVSSLLPEELAVLELCPSLQAFNLSRNKIVQVDDRLSRILGSLSTLNISYNQLPCVPQVPPNVKVLLLSHNLITHFSTKNRNHSDPFNVLSPWKNLEVLDLTNNLISDETNLLPLREIGGLKKLSLSSNPLSFKPEYRRIVGGYLSRYAISRKFELDRRNLSGSEVKQAIQDSKEGKFIPYLPASSLLVSQANSAMSMSIASTASTASSSMQRSATSISSTSRFRMTQSFDSNSSSMRSVKRKKPKIREIRNLEFPEDQENSYSEASPSVRSGSSSDSKKEDQADTSSQSQSQTENTRKALTTLRQRYGQDYWLLREAGTEVANLLKIPGRPVSNELLSRSFPSSEGAKSPSKSSVYYERAMIREKYTNEELLLIKSRKKRASSQTATATAAISVSVPEEEGQDQDQDASTPKVEEEEPDFFSMFSDPNGEEPSIFDLSRDEPPEEVFSEDGKTGVETFRIYQSGAMLSAILWDGYLMEVNPDSSVILTKCDLNRLVSIEDEKFDAETETVQFLMKFDTMKKLEREKTLIMPRDDFKKFFKLVLPFIEERTLKDFVEAMQCAKCFAQFSRAMACRTVKHEKGEAPREVRICPNPGCGHDVLLTLDNIPLPNNECLDLDDWEEERLRGPLKASTPVSSVRSQSQSIPRKSSGVFDFFRNLPSSLTPKKGGFLTSAGHPDASNSSSSGTQVVPISSNSVTPVSSDGGTGQNTKSESDIEVLSTDSSSIEVLGRHCPDSGSELELDVEVAIEIPMLNIIEPSSPESGEGKPADGVPLSESTSSSSCADSIITTYEKNLPQISHPLHIPSRMPPSGSSSLCTDASSFASNYTLTPRNNNVTGIPVKYDYVNYAKMDHRLAVWVDSVVLKMDEQLLALAKCMVVSNNASAASFLGIIFFSTKKVYFFKITGDEGDHPQDWLQKVHEFNLAKFSKLDVLIGRHGIGVDFSGKYFALVFRDSERTSAFLEFFMCEICGHLQTPPMVRDFSQTQKMMLSKENPISYFGVLRLAMCDSIDSTYSISAVLLTNEEVLLISDLGWMAGRCDKVTTTHGRKLQNLHQIEMMESDETFIRLVFEVEPQKIANWELVFETEGELLKFQECLRSDLAPRSVPTVCLSQPLEH